MDKLKKCYYKDWFIALLFSFWMFYFIPAIIGVLLLKSRKKIYAKIKSEYIDFDNHQKRLDDYQNKLNALHNEIKQKESDLLNTMQNNLSILTKEL